MGDYIDRYSLLNDLKTSVVFSGRSGVVSNELKGANKVIDRIIAMPTADVQKIKHGKWKIAKEPLGWQDVDCLVCSVCGESWITDEEYDTDYYSQYWNYCPYCGAKMDGDSE